MRLKEIGDLVNKDESTVRKWIYKKSKGLNSQIVDLTDKNSTGKMPDQTGKMPDQFKIFSVIKDKLLQAKNKNIHADFTEEEVIEILKAGGYKTLAIHLAKIGPQIEIQKKAIEMNPGSMKIVESINNLTSVLTDKFSDIENGFIEKDRKILELEKMIDVDYCQLPESESIQVKGFDKIIRFIADYEDMSYAEVCEIVFDELKVTRRVGFDVVEEEAARLKVKWLQCHDYREALYKTALQLIKTEHFRKMLNSRLI